MKFNPTTVGNLTAECTECESLYYTPTSLGKELCPECAHHLHGYDNCNHTFRNNRCEICFWDGSASDKVNNIKAKNN